MQIHEVDARDLPDLWFQAVNDILDVGRRFTIDRGSYAGQTRLEYDYFIRHVTFPGTVPILPDIPLSCGIPNPVEEDYIFGGGAYERSYLEYLMSPHKEPGESYTYGERLTKVPLTGEKRHWWDTENTEIIDKRNFFMSPPIVRPEGNITKKAPKSQSIWLHAGHVVQNQPEHFSSFIARTSVSMRCCRACGKKCCGQAQPGPVGEPSRAL